MQSKSFNVVSVLALSGVLLGSAFTNPSKAMDEDPSAPTASRRGLSEEQLNQVRALLIAGWSTSRIAGQFSVNGGVARDLRGVLNRQQVAQQTNEKSNRSEEE